MKGVSAELLVVSILCAIGNCWAEKSFGIYDNNIPEESDYEDDVRIVFPSSEDTQDQLLLVNVLFRHGNRTADSQAELYPKDPYLKETYFPYGLGQLTNAGKKREYSIGTALRRRYNNFLGEFYYPEIVESLSTDYNRTKMSLQLVLAGLFPPRSADLLQNNIYWQPVPYNYVSRSEDKLLLGVTCPRYLEIYDRYTSSPKMQSEYRKHKKMFDYIAKNSGLNVSRFLDIYQLYFGLSTESEYGLRLPSWTNVVWPDIIIDLAVREYYVSMATTEMRKMAAGYLLKKIVDDARGKIAGTIAVGRKIHLYSAHENNIAELLIALNVFKPHIPNYGAYFILEVHRINNVHGVKILYENYDGNGIQTLKMPGCNIFCPIDQFVSLIEEYFPEDNLCGN